MPTHIHILRGINVSGQKKVPMAELKTLYETAGCTEVVTYIQSGNVIFQVPAAKTKTITSAIQKAILSHFGFEVPVLSLTPQYLRGVIENNPYLRQKGIDTATLHYTFLASQPTAAALKTLGENSFPPDSFQPGDKVMYVHCPKGYGNTRLSNTWFENKLKISATTRNFKTAGELLRLTQS